MAVAQRVKGEKYTKKITPADTLTELTFGCTDRRCRLVCSLGAQFHCILTSLSGFLLVKIFILLQNSQRKISALTLVKSFPAKHESIAITPPLPKATSATLHLAK